MPKVRVNGIEIHYQRYGRGPELVMIHGLAANLAFWQVGILAALGRQFSVTVYDLRGHGYSEMPASGYTSAHMAEDLVALLDALRVYRAHVVGHSFGGVVGLQFAALHPDRLLTLTVADSRVRALQPHQRLREWRHWPLWAKRFEGRGIRLDG